MEVVKSFNAEVRKVSFPVISSLPYYFSCYLTASTCYKSSMITSTAGGIVRMQTPDFKSQDDCNHEGGHPGNQVLQACRSKRRKVHSKGIKSDHGSAVEFLLQKRSKYELKYEYNLVNLKQAPKIKFQRFGHVRTSIYRVQVLILPSLVFITSWFIFNLIVNNPPTT